MHVTADRDVCVGAGMCALTAPGVFDQDDDGLVTVLTSDIGEDDRDAVREAGMLCPSGALRVTE
ncbi:(4Fe-4S)-binding protein [Streptomyces rimosus]|uniref:ferredoxin n=1 Tax=Streptomyces rimosus TaxID=1927 RepID=UPI0005189EFD|nr:(4Fe-4S)-binding protein [Streptomyces rimosus]